MKNIIFSITIIFGLGALQTGCTDSGRLDEVLAAQSEDIQARYVYRNPKATLEFLGVKPGMTVVEVLPGGGWYSKILIPYIGPEGALIGADYPYDMLPKFGFYSDEQLAKRKTWTTDWPVEAGSWYDRDAADVSAFVLGTLPAELHGKADVILFIRALHNLHRFENDGGYFTTTLREAYAVLKPGGILGLVQHQAAEDMPDDWAQGGKGYLKKSLVIAKLTEAGFEFIDESPINHNPKDQPTTDDIVWRLPPNYFTSRKDAELHAKYEAIGESNRMTLKFRKPE
ncbi:MAG: class I SAM-dependent methyltransferase [Gammaproteobacteria bacterium]